jgi:hypothetical protein
MVEGANPTALCHRAQAPMRRTPRRRIQRQANRLGDLVIADPARRAGARLVEEAIEAMLGEPAPPFAHRVGGCVDAQADVPSRILRGINPQSESNIFADHDTRCLVPAFAGAGSV